MESDYLGTICTWSIMVGVVAVMNGLIGIDDGVRRNIVILIGTLTILIAISANVFA